jgi:hypothetical protein
MANGEGHIDGPRVAMSAELVAGTENSACPTEAKTGLAIDFYVELVVSNLVDGSG